MIGSGIVRRTLSIELLVGPFNCKTWFCVREFLLKPESVKTVIFLDAGVGADEIINKMFVAHCGCAGAVFIWNRNLLNEFARTLPCLGEYYIFFIRLNLYSIGAE